MGSDAFTVRLDDREIRGHLKALDERAIGAILLRGVRKGAPALKRAIAAEAPVQGKASAFTRRGGASGLTIIRGREREYGRPGDLRRSIAARKIRSNPAIGVAVGPMGKLGFARWWVVRGTRPHTIRARSGFLPAGMGREVRHPGAKANPFVARGVARGEAEAMQIAEDSIMEELTK